MELGKLEEEVSCIAEKFAKSVGFLDIQSMKDTAYQFKMFGDEIDASNNSQEESLNKASEDVLSPSQKMNKSRRSMYVLSKIISSDEENKDEEEKEEKKRQSIEQRRRSRKSCKSRKSVCVLPRVLTSSSSDVEDEDDNEIVFNNNKDDTNKSIVISENESNDDEEVMVNFKPKKRVQIIDSSTDTDSNDSDEGNEKEEEDTKEDKDVIRKKINYISSDDDQSVLHEVNDDSSDSNDDIKNLTKSMKSQTIQDDDDSSETESDDEFDNFLDNAQKKKNTIEEENSVDSEDSLKDFIVPDDGESSEEYEKEEVFKTPARPRKALTEKHIQKLVTPFSASRNILHSIQTPKSVAGTPAYKREFKRVREQVVKKLFELFNQTVFDKKLPEDLEIIWNNRMRKTAGFCYYSKTLNTKKSRIELSEKVLDCTERVRDTLIHELCHAATWLINGEKAGHGTAWKYWAKRANKTHPDLPIIARCHQYKIHTKYNYKCNGCGLTFGRHSKSIDSTKHRCASCGGVPELINDQSSASATPKTPNAYAMFVKENFATVKKSNPGISHREIMIKISEKFKASKTNKENI